MCSRTNDHDSDDEDAPSSPPCLMHEFAAELVPPPGDWPAVRELRKAKRAELLARRAALTFHDRQHYAESLTAHLLASLDLRRFGVLGIYWPIRGELDLRDLARRHIEVGGAVALPVVVEKHAPIEFWRWRPGGSLRRGFWNIPVPVERDCIVPDALLIPLVGYDAAGFRLGYGGGYYDRTLAAATPRPLCVGVGYDDSALATIHPQPHDIPMDWIVTERRAQRVARAAATSRR